MPIATEDSPDPESRDVLQDYRRLVLAELLDPKFVVRSAAGIYESIRTAATPKHPLTLQFVQSVLDQYKSADGKPYQEPSKAQWRSTEISEVQMSLQDKLDAFRADFEGKKAPPEVVAIMHKATADLIASGQADRALKAGARAPEFALPDGHGVLMRSADLLGRGPLVLTFYRGIWCPYCNMDLQAIEAVAGEIRGLGASLLAISPQTAPNRRKSERENALSFPILNDHGNAVANFFGLRFRLPEDLIALYKGFGNDLTIGNGEDSSTLPMPARYVIGTDGVIAYADVNPDYTRRPDPSELVPVLRRLRTNAAP